MNDNNTDLISIQKERLKSLELLEESIPSLIEKAIQDYKKAKLKMLHEKDTHNHNLHNNSSAPTFLYTRI